MLLLSTSLTRNLGVGLALVPRRKSQQRAPQRGAPWLVRASHSASEEQTALLHRRGELLCGPRAHTNSGNLKENRTKSSICLETCCLASPATCSRNTRATSEPRGTLVVLTAALQLLPSHCGAAHHIKVAPCTPSPGALQHAGDDPRERWLPAPWHLPPQCSSSSFLLSYSLNLVHPVLSPRDTWVVQ